MPVLLLTLAHAESGEGSVSAAEGDGIALSEQVVVEGERARGPDPRRTAAAVTVMDVAQRATPADDVASLLEMAPGATVERLGGLGDWSGVAVRGSSARQVIVALDGVPLNPDGGAVINLSELPLGAFQRVELYRGDAPPELGAAPVGGVVNLVTGEDRAPTAATLSAGSFGTLRGLGAGGARGELGGAPADAWAMVEGVRTAGDFPYFDDNGTTWNMLDDSVHGRENNEKAQLTAHARARVGREGLRLTLLNALLLRDERLPGNADAPAEEASLSTWRNLGVAELGFGDAGLHGTARAWGWGREELYDDRAGEIGTGQTWSRQRTGSVGLLGSARLGGSGPFVTTAAGTLRRDTWSAEDLIQGAEEGPRRRLAGTATLGGIGWFAADSLALEPRLLLTVLDNHDLLGAAEVASPTDAVDTTLHVHLDPRLGLIWRPTDTLALKLRLGTAFRPPDMSELFGDRGSTVGNPELVPERARGADLGLRVELPAGRWAQGGLELTGFLSRSRDLISYVQTGQQVMVPINLGQTRTDGLESAAELKLGNFLESYTALCWTRSENLSEDPIYAGKQLPRVPTWDLSQSTALSTEGPHALRLSHTFSYTDGYTLDAANVQWAAPRALHSAALSVELWGPLSLSLDVQNLLDRQVEVVPRNPQDPDDPARVVVAITDLNGYPLPGRSFLLSLRAVPDPEER